MNRLSACVIAFNDERNLRRVMNFKKLGNLIEAKRRSPGMKMR
jgi:hypothetical protein